MRFFWTLVRLVSKIFAFFPDANTPSVLDVLFLCARPSARLQMCLLCVLGGCATASSPSRRWHAGCTSSAHIYQAGSPWKCMFSRPRLRCARGARDLRRPPSPLPPALSENTLILQGTNPRVGPVPPWTRIPLAASHSLVSLKFGAALAYTYAI